MNELLNSLVIYFISVNILLSIKSVIIIMTLILLNIAKFIFPLISSPFIAA